jgi:hypothetical protein
MTFGKPRNVIPQDGYVVVARATKTLVLLSDTAFMQTIDDDAAVTPRSVPPPSILGLILQERCMVVDLSGID